MLSEKTISEMKAGAKQVENNLRGTLANFTEEQFEAMMATQERMRCLKQWEREGQIRIEWCKKLRTNDADSIVWTQIYVGPKGLMFNDIPAEQAGTFPSAVLIANIALALASGQGLE